MANQISMARILAADIGSAATHVCLLDNIEGRYRLVARGDALTTANDVNQGVMAGLIQAMRQIERVVQYPLLDTRSELISPDPREGVMPVTFCATLSAASPLRVLILGLSSAFSISSARRACLLPVVDLAGTLELDLVQSGDDAYWTNLYHLYPEVIVLVGGFDDAPARPLEISARRLLSLYDKTSRDQRPIVIFAGNQAAVHGRKRKM